MQWMRRLLQVSAVILALLAVTAASPAQEVAFTFVQISDSQPADADQQQLFEDVLATIVDAGQPGALLPKPVDVVFFAGDLVSSNHVNEWVTWTQTMSSYLTAAGIPFICVPGNHDQDTGGIANYELFVADSGVWSQGSELFTGQNGLTYATGWLGLRVIGFNNSNGGWNVISPTDLAEIGNRVAAASAAGENIMLLCHHPHNGQGVVPLAGILPNPNIVCYLRGHSGNPHLTHGLSGISNPNVWDCDTNAINHNADLFYNEVFTNRIEVHVVQLVNNPTVLPPASIITLVHPLVPAGGVPLDADFAAQPVTGPAPLAVSFTDLSTGAPTSWSWSFGDGGTATVASPQHVYADPGSYTVTLTVTNDTGSDTLTVNNFITGTADQNTALTLTPIADAKVSSGSVTTNYGSEADLRCRFGGTNETTYHSYLKFDVAVPDTAAIATATLRLFVTDGSDDGGSLFTAPNGWTESTITYANAPSITGTALGNAGVVADNTWMQFDVSSVVTSPGTYSFALTSASSNSVFYTSREGAVPPQLVVTTVEVVPLHAGFAAQPLTGAAPLAVSFTDLSTGAPTSWSWSFGDGGTATVANPQHVYADPGSYTVALTVTNDTGSDTLTVNNFITATADQTTVLTLTPIADAKVSSGSVTANYGSEADLRCRFGGTSETTYHSYLKFDVAVPDTAAIAGATLRLYVTDGSNDGGSLFTVSNGWTEPTITYANAPSITGTALDNAGVVADNTWIQFDVTSVVTSPGTYSFGLTSASSNSVFYSSREGAEPPQLVLPVTPLCGNGTTDPGETCATCPGDAPCAPGAACQAGQCVTACPWDINDDGAVAVVDMLDLLSAWGPNPGHPADVNDDGAVGVADFLELLSHWGPCP